MINAIELLKMEAHTRRGMTTPNEHITKHVAEKNAKLADEYDFAAETLRQMHNKAFEDGILAGVKELVKSCEARRSKK